MPHHDHIALSGVIQHVFAHRFTLLADQQAYLADLGPKGAEAFDLKEGLSVSLEGERRPSEIKVTRIRAANGPTVEVAHKKPHHGPGHGPKHPHPDAPADPRVALAAARQAGWSTADAPRQKPKHFEVLARHDNGAWMELHIDFAGNLYKQKPADPGKWPLPS